MESVKAPADQWLTGFLRDRHLRLCAVISLIFVFMPPEGLGVELCLYKRLLNLPCPGCGITRSGSNLVRGDFAKVLNYNPFGLVIVPMIFALGILALTPLSWREEVRQRLLPAAGILRAGYFSVIVAFVIFGLVRMFFVYEGWAEFPSTWF